MANKTPAKKARGVPARVDDLESDLSGMDLEDNSLFYIIQHGKASLQSIVNDWIDIYKVDNKKGLLDLLQLFISTTGCKGKLNPEVLDKDDWAEVINKLVEEFEEDCGDYPLIAHGVVWRKFRTNMTDFLQILMKQCQYSIVYDQCLMNNIISLLTQLSDSQVRAFRHTATYISMKIMSALVDVLLVVSINAENIQRQYNAEHKKAQLKAMDRLESLKEKKKELEENIAEVINMQKYFFKTIFIHRYRDIVADIRSICMQEIGIWMLKFHSLFLDDMYLKYIGWTLNDKIAEVRLKCLQSLQPLFSTEQFLGKLELFAQKFKDRIVQMTLDKDNDVAVHAVRVITSIWKAQKIWNSELLSDQDSEHMYELVYSSHRAVAHAAGEFVNVRLISELTDQDTRTKRGKKRLPNTARITALVQFFIEADLHEHGAYLVDSLIESNIILKDWECMTDLLLEEPGEAEEPLDNKEESALIEIMVCCIRQAATGKPPVGREPTRKGFSAKELRQVQHDKQALTAHFIHALPHLLHKHLPDAEKISNLLVIPQFFDLDTYTTLRQEKNLDRLLSLIQEIVEKHSDKEVLEECAKSLEILCDKNYAISTRCETARSRLLDIISDKFKEANDEYINILLGKEEPDDDEKFNLVSSLKKVECFINAHSMSQCNIWESMFDLVLKYKESSEYFRSEEHTNNSRRVSFQGEELKIPLEAVRSAMCACHYGLIWDKVNMEDKNRASELSANEVNRLRNDFQRYLKTMREMISQPVLGPGSILREEAFTYVCDLLIIYRSNGEEEPENSMLAPLLYCPEKKMAQLLNEFIQTNVFVPEEDQEDEIEQDDYVKIEVLQKRRNFLASFCKLVIYKVLPTICAADIFKHYLMFYADYGDIIKGTLAKVRENDKVHYSKALLHTLKIKFNELKQSQGGNIMNRDAGEFIRLKELAKRFALTFGVDPLKSREAVTTLHKEGIKFSVDPMANIEKPNGPPPNLPFMEILTEFTNKLLKQDKSVVLKYIDQRLGNAIPPSGGDDWQPCLIYRNSLVHGESEMPGVSSDHPDTRKPIANEDDNA